MKLKIEKSRCSSGLDTLRISGFTDEELYGLKKVSNNEAKDMLIEMLDERNNGEGTCYACGYGIYGVWFDNEFAYMNVGTTCD